MSWTYKQSTGELRDSSGKLVATGYAGGNCGKAPEGKNNPDMQCVVKTGPLPRGLYTFGAPVMQSHLGPFAIPLKPDQQNEMFGRSAFFMHGDRTSAPGSASEGCIIMPRSVREECWNSKDHTLTVIK